MVRAHRDISVPNHDPLFEVHRSTANLRILEIDEIKTVPHVPLSHPFVERLIGTVRREFLDHVLFWNAVILNGSWARCGMMPSFDDGIRSNPQQSFVLETMSHERAAPTV